jgi:hypoxia up-regulated 1
LDFTPEELVAMVLTHAVDITVAYSAESGGSVISPPRDVVLTVPCFATQKERKALLDAALLADLNVLTLIDENTAAALHYAMDKQFEGPENEKLLLFYNLGNSALEVSLVRFFNYDHPQKYGKPKSVPAFEVLAKAWDETLGGESFDHLLVEMLADEFNKEWRKARNHDETKDVRNYPRAMTKLRLQANKIKHVLSANVEIPIHMDNVHDDVSLVITVTREQFENLGKELFGRVVTPVLKVLEYANKTASDLTGTELIGGGMRIPRIHQKLQEALGESIDLGLHMNADESAALGAAFAGANISTAFRVRQVGMVDVNPFAMEVILSDLPLDSSDGAKKGFFGGKKQNDDADDSANDVWTKKAVIFKTFGKMGVKKSIAFTHDRDVECSLNYADESSGSDSVLNLLPKGTEKALERYEITGVSDFAKEMTEKGLDKPKVSLQFELSSSGIASLVKAEATVTELYTVEEEVEVDDDEEKTAEGDESKDQEEASEEKTAEQD